MKPRVCNTTGDLLGRSHNRDHSGPYNEKENQMTETIAGASIPDTVVIKVATELVLDAEDDLLFHHSRRVYL
jgi:hypothetical protein